MPRAKVLVLGGGPAGAIAALTLNKLGHDVEVFEREAFPRHQIGESLLPGTLSILKRLGLEEKLNAAGFLRKPSATFLWGQDQPPYTFSFATHRPAEWILDYAIQVYREEFDTLLLNEAQSRGVRVNFKTAVKDVDLSSPDEVRVMIEGPMGKSTVRGDYLIDGSGAHSVLARKLQTRQFDEFYRSFAVWSYFRCPERYTGELKGTTFSITFEDGWAWMIPLKGDVYSVGLVVDQSKSAEMREKGITQFFTDTLAKCRGAMKILGDAPMIDKVRVIRDWAYDTSTYSSGRFFFSGDAACFTDPLFSQGIQLAAQSAVSASAAIDRMMKFPEESERIHQWYASSYKESYEQYHQFVASFYTYASFTEPDSEFWRKRRLQESEDSRLERREWFQKLFTSVHDQDKQWTVEDFRDRSSTLIAIGRHKRKELSSEFSESELTLARVQWISKLTATLNSITNLRWSGKEAVLRPYYKVHPLDFTLTPKFLIGDETGRVMTKYPVEPKDLDIFREILTGQVSYKTLVRNLSAAGATETSSQIIVRMFEAGLLTGYDKNGKRVHVQDRLRFDGVGAELEV